ncbi:hypothetical protein J7K93_02925 [bacterium]|nr:hypothetical protein [bacterium]
MIIPGETASEILLQELECAESVKSGAFEIQQLLDRGAIEQAEEKLTIRGQIIRHMVELDENLQILRDKGLLDSGASEWKDVVTLARSLRDITRTITKVDAGTRDKLEKKGREISIKLNKLLDGKKNISGYTNERNRSSSAAFSA